MNEDLESKLNELLGLKQQMEETTAAQRQKDISSTLEQYKKEARRSRIRFVIGMLVGIAFQWLGAAGLGATKMIIMGHDISGTPAQYALGGTFMSLGIFVISITIITACIRAGNLRILAGFKQFELRLTEILKNK